MTLFTKYENTVAVILAFLKRAGIEKSASRISNELEKHPDYPSLLALSDVLYNFQIENSAYQVGAEEVGTVPCPFIANTNINNGDFLVVNKIVNGRVYVTNEKWNNRCLSLYEFKKIFTGTVLTANSNYLLKAKGSNIPDWKTYKVFVIVTGLLLILIVAVCFIGHYLEFLNWRLAMLTLFKSIGIVITVLLLLQSIDSENPLVQAFCNVKGKANCNAVLSSKAAKVFNGLSWSEVGFFYFVGTWLLLIFDGSNSFLVWLLILLNLISLPYTFFSVYYQLKVAKQWCILCCTVVVLLWVEALTMFVFNGDLSFIYKTPMRGFKMSVILEVLPEIVISLFLPVFLWFFIKPYLLELQQIPKLKRQLRKFKYNSELFEKMLQSQPYYVSPDKDWSIVLGNLEAGNIITIVSNPYCQPCSKIHQALNQLLSENNNVQARIVFTARNKDEDLKTPVSRHLMALNNLQDKKVIRKALDDWYSETEKDYEIWAKAYPVEIKETEFYRLDKQRSWCKMAAVTVTPTMLINGYRLPNVYQLTDLTYLLE